MLGVSWGALVHPTCSCIGDCTCQARIRQTNLQESLDSLGIEWGLRVRPKPYSPKKQVRESLSLEEAIHIDSSSTEAESEEEARDPLRAFDDVCISEGLADRLCFRERLEVAETPAGSALGQVVVSVCRSRTFGHLHVRVAGNADLPTGALCSTSVVGCVDFRNQRTADERRYERCEEKDKGVQEKFLYMAQDEGNKAGHYFSIAARQRVGEYEDRRSQEVPFADVANLISEALTVILLRYVGLTGYVGTLHLQAVLPNGALVPCEFEAEEAKKRMVYGHEVKCAAVTQYSADARGCPVVLRSLISTTTGQILRHAPVGEPEEGGNIGFVLRVPHKHPPAVDREELSVPEPLAHDWDDDLQAQGMHRDKKEELLIRYRSFLLDRPEVRWLLTNYVQAALLARPDDALALARHHFAMPPSKPQLRPRTDPAAWDESPFFGDWDPWGGSQKEEFSFTTGSPRTPYDVVDSAISAAVAAATDAIAQQDEDPYAAWRAAQERPYDPQSEEESSTRRPGAYETEGEGETESASYFVPATRGGDMSTEVGRQQAPGKTPYEPDQTGDELETSQTFDQQYGSQQYPDERYPQEEYPDQEYQQGEYPGEYYPQEYSNQQYPQGEYPDPQYSQGEYPDQQQPRGEFPDQQQPRDEYPDQQYPRGEYPDQQQPRGEFPDQQQPRDEYPDQQQPRDEYPDQQYPRGEYPDQQQPRDEYPDQQQPRDEYPDQQQLQGEYPDQQYPRGENPDQQYPQADYPDQKYPQQDEYPAQYPQQDQYAQQQYPQQDQYPQESEEYPQPPASEQREMPRPEFLDKDWANPASGREPLRFPQQKFPESSPHDTRPPGEYGPHSTL